MCIGSRQHSLVRQGQHPGRVQPHQGFHLPPEHLRGCGGEALECHAGKHFHKVSSPSVSLMQINSQQRETHDTVQSTQLIVLLIVIIRLIADRLAVALQLLLFCIKCTSAAAKRGLAGVGRFGENDSRPTCWVQRKTRSLWCKASWDVDLAGAFGVLTAPPTSLEPLWLLFYLLTKPTGIFVVLIRALPISRSLTGGSGWSPDSEGSFSILIVLDPADQNHFQDHVHLCDAGWVSGPLALEGQHHLTPCCLQALPPLHHLRTAS